MNDVISVLAWWVTLFVIGIIFLPLTSRIFSRFLDRGYIFSKILGTIVISYAALILGMTQIIPFSFPTLLCISLIALVMNYRVLNRPTTKMAFQRIWKISLFEEVLFLVALAFWAYIRAHDPNINGLEKFMDFGFINSILRSDSFPPKDMWFTPFSINYYYFGHLTTAVLTKLSMLPSYITYNLMLATIFGFALVSSFSIGSNLFYSVLKRVKKEVFVIGILAALLVAISGNLHAMYTLFTPYENEKPVPPWELQISPTTFPNGYWYPNATRFIPFTIHEFPMYSHVVADLHGHVLSIPFVLLAIALILQTFIIISNSALAPPSQNIKRSSAAAFYNRFLSFLSLSNREFLYFVLLGFLVAVLYMTNAWDGPIYFMLAALAIGTAYLTQQENRVVRIIAAIIIILVSFVIFSMPFNLTFKPFVSGFGMVCPPEFLINVGKIGPFLFEKDRCQRSEIYQWVILWGFFMFFAVSFTIAKLLTRKKDDLFKHVDLFVMCMIVLSTFLLVVPEFFYASDIYPTHFRANTMFKLGYQAFIMMSIASAYILIRIVKGYKQWWFLILSAPLIALVLIYSYLSTITYYGDGDGLKQYQGLNGIKYLQTSRPDDYQTILWLIQNVKGQPVILEAQGDSYTDFARISANTGLPTVLGWTVHEWLWRGTYDIPAPRISEVKIMYETTDVLETQRLLNQYDVEYIVVGDLERQQYPALQEDKFKQLGNVVFQSGDTRLYKLR